MLVSEHGEKLYIPLDSWTVGFITYLSVPSGVQPFSGLSWGEPRRWPSSCSRTELKLACEREADLSVMMKPWEPGWQTVPT